MLKLIYVCTGNILRSPAAERITREELYRRGMNGVVAVSSAGLFDRRIYLDEWKKMAKALKALGYKNLAHTKPRVIQPRQIIRSDLILCMEQYHAENLSERMGKNGRRSAITTMHSFSDGTDKDIEDPFFGEDEEYLATAIELQSCVVCMLPRVEELAFKLYPHANNISQ